LIGADEDEIIKKTVFNIPFFFDIIVL